MQIWVGPIDLRSGAYFSGIFSISFLAGLVDGATQYVGPYQGRQALWLITRLRSYYTLLLHQRVVRHAEATRCDMII